MRREFPHAVRKMSARIATEQINKMVGLESRGWGDQAQALKRIAFRYDLNHGTLDNLRTGRVKTILADLRDDIRRAYLDMLERQVKRWEVEIAVERAKGTIDDDLRDMELEAQAFRKRIEARRARLDGRNGGRK